MTADTRTPLLGLLLQGTGNNNNSWGQNNNDQVIQFTEDAIAGQAVITSTGGTYTLDEDEARASTLVLSNTLASDLTIVVPDTAKIYRIANFNTVNAFTTVLKCVTAATAVSVPCAKINQVIVIGGTPFRADRCEVGRYVYDAASVNGDSLKCDGTLYKRAKFPDLFTKIGTAYGTTDSTDFRVPNAYDTGRFLRSDSASVAVATSQSNQNKSHTHTGSGTTSGQSVGHTHTGSGTTTGASVGHTHTGSGSTGNESADHSHTGSGTTSAMSANADHTHNLGAAQSAFLVAVNNGGGASQGNLVCTSATTSAGLVTSSTNIDHTHTYSFTTSGVSNDHTHTFTTSGQSATHTHTYSFTTGGVSVFHTHAYSFTTSGVSADHTHTYSFTTATGSADHTHTYSFTTSTGSADGTEARPEALVAVLCIRY